MKVLHVTPHLGGGVGKAHAALGGALPKDIERTFVLLEEPRDCRYADMIAAGGAPVIVARDLEHVAELARAADIVQFEFWNHPRLYECLARCAFPAMRSVFWSHISGLARPVIQPALIEIVGRFVFTTEASRPIARTARKTIEVINSGFGFADPAPRPHRDKPVIAYLGTVDFVKMHPGFFDAVDRLSSETCVMVWGHPSDAVTARARAMRHPERIQFSGQTSDPAGALSVADIFFYPLQPDHYGTAENALIEAMSLGLAPVVLNNPAEMAIVRDRETGLVAHSIDDCVVALQTLLASAGFRRTISQNAARDVAETRNPQQSARGFIALWQSLLAEPARPHDFARAIGDLPADWFLATQCLPGETWRPTDRGSEAASKGGLTHFESVFPGDASLSALAKKKCIQFAPLTAPAKPSPSP